MNNCKYAVRFYLTVGIYCYDIKIMRFRIEFRMSTIRYYIMHNIPVYR